MNQYNNFIGIDISKKTLDVCLLTREGKKIAGLHIKNQAKDLKSLAKQFKKQGIDLSSALFCCEHTGLYGAPLLNWATESKFDLWVAHATNIKRSIGMQRGKSDKIDAFRIAYYALRFQDKCELWAPPRQVIKELQQLTTLRARLVKVESQITLPLNEMRGFISSKGCVQSSTLTIQRTIKRELKKINQQIAKLCKSDKQLAQQMKIIQSVKGVGVVTASELILRTEEFKKINTPKKLACYAGVAPFPYQSGTSVQGRTRVSNLANKTLKKYLHMAALSATRNSDEMRIYYERKIAEGKPKMLVLNAVRNKLLQRICACIRDNRLYENTNPKKVV